MEDLEAPAVCVCFAPALWCGEPFPFVSSARFHGAGRGQGEGGREKGWHQRCSKKSEELVWDSRRHRGACHGACMLLSVSCRIGKTQSRVFPAPPPVRCGAVSLPEIRCFSLKMLCLSHGSIPGASWDGGEAPLSCGPLS